MPDRDPGDVPPRRLLEHAPSDRFGAGAAAVSGQALAGAPSVTGRVGARLGGEVGGLMRATLLGLGAAAIGALVHVAVAVLLLATGGLLVVAATLGFGVGAFVRYGAGSRVRASVRRGLGVALAVAAVGVALAVNWGLSGAYLGPLDFLAQVYGTLVPLQVAAAVAGALAGTR